MHFFLKKGQNTPKITQNRLQMARNFFNREGFSCKKEVKNIL